MVEVSKKFYIKIRSKAIKMDRKSNILLFYSKIRIDHILTQK